MKNIRTLGLLAGMLFLAGWLTSAYAIPLGYTVTGSDLDLNDSDPGLVLQRSLYGLPGTFSLDDGESERFAFADIWTDETFVNADDLVSKTALATVSFNPPLLDATVSGLSSGVMFSGIFQAGVLLWNSPKTFILSDRTFNLELSNSVFNTGLFGLTDGEKYGATIYATVTQLSSSGVSVPDGGSTVLLLGMAFTGLGLLSRRRRRVLN